MKVFITRKIPGRCEEILRENNIEVIVNPHDRALTSSEIIEYAKECEGLISLLGDKIDRNIIDSLHKLKIISNYAVGYNNIDFDYAREKCIYVTNTPGVLTNTTADLGFALMMAVARKIPQSDVYIREGKFKGWEPELFQGYDIYGKTIGIIGMGRIGSAIAKRAKGFDMNIIYNSRTRKSDLESELGINYMDVEGIASFSDFIILCCPLTDETKHLVDEKFLSRMKQNAIIVNLARGPVVDEEKLIKVLIQGKIAGAGFDVYYNEPEIPDELKKLDNVVLLPHTGSASFETRGKMGEMCAESCVDVLINNKVPEFNVY